MRREKFGSSLCADYFVVDASNDLWTCNAAEASGTYTSPGGFEPFVILEIGLDGSRNVKQPHVNLQGKTVHVIAHLYQPVRNLYTAHACIERVFVDETPPNKGNVTCITCTELNGTLYFSDGQNLGLKVEGGGDPDSQLSDYITHSIQAVMPLRTETETCGNVESTPVEICDLLSIGLPSNGFSQPRPGTTVQVLSAGTKSASRSRGFVTSSLSAHLALFQVRLTETNKAGLSSSSDWLSIVLDSTPPLVPTLVACTDGACVPVQSGDHLA